MKYRRSVYSLLIVMVMVLINFMIFKPDKTYATNIYYRLPFIGYQHITSGPGCYHSHRNSYNYEAIDFGLNTGTAVVAAASGIAKAKGSATSDDGLWIEIEHDNGQKSVYFHLSEIDIDDGQLVEQGQQIGLSGATGWAEGAHLHFAVIENYSAQNFSGNSVPIRELSGMTWYSGDANNPCQPYPQPDGEAIGEPVSGVFQIVASHSGKCLEVGGGNGSTANGPDLQQWTCVGETQRNQLWRFERVGGALQLKAAHSGKCIDVAGGVNATGDDVRIQQWDCLGASQTNQLWNVIAKGNGFQLVARHSNKCLDVTGGTGSMGDGVLVHQWACFGAAETNQIWNLRPIGKFQIAVQHSEKCLDVAGGVGAIQDDANVHQWTCTDQTQLNQWWELRRIGQYYQIVAKHSGKCLDVTGGTGATSDGVKLHQWTCMGAGQTNQLWQLRPAGAGFQLVAAHSNKCVDVSGGRTVVNDGAQIIQWNCRPDNNTNQTWIFR